MWITDRQFWLLASSPLAGWHTFGMEWKEHIAYRLLSWALIIAVVCGLAVINPAPVIGVTPVQMCTAQNVAGFPYSGAVCGGSVIDGCGPGAIYQCTGGARNTTNNCILAQACAVGCLTGTHSTPVTLNTQTPSANDACFTGAAPLTFSTNATPGGIYVTMTATLEATHSPYAIVNLEGTGPLVPPLCDVPLFLMANTNTVSFVEPTGVVNTPTTVPLWVLISYTDAATGRGRNLVSVPSSLTLNPGGTLVVPPLLSFSLTDGAGATISTIPGGSNAFTQGTLSA